MVPVWPRRLIRCSLPSGSSARSALRWFLGAVGFGHTEPVTSEPNPPQTSDLSVSGFCDERFAAVQTEFERNFVDRGEVGASVHVLLDGEPVIDLWGGTTDRDGTLWTDETVTTVFSCTKGATALCAHLLIDRGELDLDALVADYWPEFATNGKELVTVAMMLNHSAGVPALRERLADGTCCDWDAMAGAIAAEEPWWEPGTRNGYHMFTFGWTAGELVRRVSGRSLGTFFAEEIAGPLGADFWIGLPDDKRDRVAKVLQPRPDRDGMTEFTKAAVDNAGSLQRMALMNTGGFGPNDPEVQKAEIGGAGGISNAKGLARMYSAAAIGGGDLFSPEAVARMSEVSAATGVDATLLLPTRFGLGFMKSMDNRRRPVGDRDSVVLGSAAFGHVGAGGSIGFADPANRLSFGYSMNAMGPGILLNERGQALVDATYDAINS